jgi:hypothetical protein
MMLVETASAPAAIIAQAFLILFIGLPLFAELAYLLILSVC